MDVVAQPKALVNATSEPPLNLPSKISKLQYENNWKRGCFQILFLHLGLTLPPYHPPADTID
jgi:hypothetical protein